VDVLKVFTLLTFGNKDGSLPRYGFEGLGRFPSLFPKVIRLG
jgi:hypothetical protein